jgi:hypothetical protein
MESRGDKRSQEDSKEAKMSHEKLRGINKGPKLSRIVIKKSRGLKWSPEELR